MNPKRYSKREKTPRSAGLHLPSSQAPGVAGKKKLEIVLKCDSVGSEEAIISSLSGVQDAKTELKIIHSDVGNISKSDLLLALTGSRLVVGFNVGVGPKIKELCREQDVEVRLYEVIYNLTNDLEEVTKNLATHDEDRELITGKAEVIALYKSSRGGIILGCNVLEGTLELGRDFRIVSAMGTIYTGKIQSIQIEHESVKEAKVRQHVGLKILDLKKARVGDLVECFKTVRQRGGRTWLPRGGIFKM